MFTKFLEDDGREISITTKADFKVVGQWFALTGLILVGIVYAVYLFAGIPELIILEVVPGIFILVGGLFALVGNKTVFSKAAREIAGKSGRLSYDSIDSVLVSSYVQRTSKSSSQRFIISLVIKSDIGSLTELIDSLDDFAEKFNDRELTEELEEEIVNEFEKHQELLSGIILNSIVIGDNGNEMLVWQAAERIAKELKVPVVDQSGENLLYRKVDELDLSLKDRLLKNKVERILPEKTDSKIRVRKAKDLEIEWDHSRVFDIGMIAFLIIFLLGMGLLLASETNVYLGLIMYIPAIMVAFLMKNILKGHGTNKLVVGSDFIASQLSYAKPERFSLKEVETLRVNNGIQETLNIISDNKIARIPMKLETASWIVERIEYFLIYGK